MPNEDSKTLKKLAKARVKAEKKAAGSPTEEAQTLPAAAEAGSAAELTPAERSALAAERQVALNKWKVIASVVSAIVALITLIVLFWK